MEEVQEQSPISDSTLQNYSNPCFAEVGLDCLSNEEYEDFLFQNYVLPDPIEWIFLPAFFLLLFFGIAGNILVCFVVAKNSTMRTVTNIFLVNLAAADFLVILFCMPFTLLWDITSTWHFGTVPCKLISYVNFVSISVSVLTLTAISVERWYAICYPLAFTATLGRTLILIGLIWFVAMLISLPELIVLQVQPYRFNRPNYTSKYFDECTDDWGDKQKVYQLVQTTVLFVFPISLMACMYGQIAKVLWSQRIPSDDLSTTRVITLAIRMTTKCRRSSNEINKEKEALHRRKAAKMLIAVVALFGVCYLPTHVRNVLLYFDYWPNLQYPYASLFQVFMRFLCYLNSCANPVIYNFMSEKFRKEFRRAVVCLSSVDAQSQSNYPNALSERASLLEARSLGMVAIAIAQMSYDL